MSKLFLLLLIIIAVFHLMYAFYKSVTKMTIDTIEINKKEQELFNLRKKNENRNTNRRNNRNHITKNKQRNLQQKPRKEIHQIRIVYIEERHER